MGGKCFIQHVLRKDLKESADSAELLNWSPAELISSGRFF